MVAQLWTRLSKQQHLRVALLGGGVGVTAGLIALSTHETLAAVVSGAALVTAAVAGVRCTIDGRSHRGAIARLHEAIAPMAEGIAFFDSHDRAIVWNSRYAELVDHADALKPGVSFEELIRGNLRAGMHPEAVGREDEWLADRLATRSRMGADEHKNGDRWVRAERRRTRDGGLVTVVMDVTEFRRATEILAESRDSAEAANRAKSEFLANVSHELRTPLNGVLGIAEVLARTPLNDKQKEMVETIRQSGATLEALVADIIDLARLESGKVSAVSEVFDLGEHIRAAARLHGLHAAKKNVAFAIDIAPDADGMVTGDPERLRQILGNLLSNAVKFTDHGEVRLTVDRPDAGGDTLRFAVTDTGVGFTADFKARIFERFQQADGSSTRRHGGTGLGLAVSKQAANLLGGDLQCDSALGQGSTFTLTLSLPPAVAQETARAARGDTPAIARAVAAAVAAAEEQREEGHALRVLVVDDHPTNRRVVEMILDQVGAERVSVENGQEALEAYVNDRFDVVLMDIQMPVMDGLTATQRIRLMEKEAHRPSTPVIILSANALPEHIEAGRAAGAQRHLSKPISAAVLLSAIAEVANECGDEEAAA